MSAIGGPDGRTLVEVMGEDATDRWNVRVWNRHARLGASILVEYEDGHTVVYGVVSILEQRGEASECPSTEKPRARACGTNWVDGSDNAQMALDPFGWIERHTEGVAS